MPVKKVVLTDSEWAELEPQLTHHGHLSHILREGVRHFLEEKREEKRKEGGKNGGSGKGEGRRSATTQTNRNR